MCKKDFGFSKNKSGGGGGVSSSTPIGASLMKSGQKVSYRTGDDGDIEAGRSGDFFTLPLDKDGNQLLNIFGNNKRFTGLTGGYQVGVVYYDKDGVVTTGALAFPNDIMIDWSLKDTYLDKVLGYKRTLESSKTWNAAIDDPLSLSIGTYTSGWRLSNTKEVFNLFNFDDTLDRMTAYPPLNISTTENIWTANTYRMGSNAFRVDNLQAAFGPFSKTGTSAKSFIVREFTIIGTTLT